MFLNIQQHVQIFRTEVIDLSYLALLLDKNFQYLYNNMFIAGKKNIL